MENHELQGQLRLRLLKMHHQANAGHIACSLSCIDLLIGSLILNKKNEDTFILSKGHAATALYVSLNYTGELTDKELETFYKNGTYLPAHPAANIFKGIPFALGSLGHGLPIATGIAKANQLSKTGGFSYVLMSDGDTNEGTTWEAAHFAVKHKLDNLIILIDKNRLQGFGLAEDVLGDTAKENIFTDLGFEVKTADGHDVAAISGALSSFRNSKNGKPKVLIGNTVKGKGVNFMENKLEWHYLPMNDELYANAQAEIKMNYGA